MKSLTLLIAFILSVNVMASGPFTYQVAEVVPFDNTTNNLNSEDVQKAIEEVNNKVNVAVFTIPLVYNGTASGDIFISYSNLTPNSPIIIPVNAEFTGFTFSNANSNADYALEFRINSETGTPFYSVSKDNTQYFADNNPSQNFTAGDIISVKYLDQGNNSNDVVIILAFKAIP